MQKAWLRCNTPVYAFQASPRDACLHHPKSVTPVFVTHHRYKLCRVRNFRRKKLAHLHFQRCACQTLFWFFYWWPILQKHLIAKRTALPSDLLFAVARHSWFFWHKHHSFLSEPGLRLWGVNCHCAWDALLWSDLSLSERDYSLDLLLTYLILNIFEIGVFSLSYWKTLKEKVHEEKDRKKQ